MLIATLLREEGLIPEDFEHQITVITLILFELFFYYSPIEGVNIRTLRGKLADFNIDDERMAEGDNWRAPLVSYKQTMDIDFGFNISFEKWPRIFTMIFQKLFGIPPVFDLNIKLTLDADLHKIPIVV
ncbi:MAG: hypothetical protein MJ219_01605 [Mycoplasmoidaceae bacterium]|nr:hypothetical protein [Mycoplasmoidaceae bacterium]